MKCKHIAFFSIHIFNILLIMAHVAQKVHDIGRSGAYYNGVYFKYKINVIAKFNIRREINNSK